MTACAAFRLTVVFGAWASVLVSCSSPASEHEDLATMGAAVTTDSVTNAADDLRTGFYPDQPRLDPATVAGATFGQLFSIPIVGQVYAQPLLAAGTLLVVTEANRVYGLDPENGASLWPPLDVGTPWNANDLGCADLLPTIGITGTPVVDGITHAAYFFSKTYASGNSGPAAWYAHSIDVTTGQERAGFPLLIQGTADNDARQTFDATHEMQRPGLLLQNDVVYAGFGGHCDRGPWYGWVVGVSTAGKLQTMWTSQSGDTRTDGAGIWHSGSGLVSDGSGRIFLATGNGGAPTGPIRGATPPGSLGEAVVRLQVGTDGKLTTSDFFAPFDATALDGWDADLGSGGPMALPDSFGTAAYPHLLVEVGKQGYVYLLNRDNLGGIGNGANGGDAVVNRVGPFGGVWSKPTLWPGDGGYVFIPTASGGNSAGGSSGFLRAYALGVDGAGKPSLALAASSDDSFGFSSSSAVVTASGTTTGSALAWIIWAPDGSGNGAQLRAYDAVPQEGKLHLRFSAAIGQSAKFTPPGVGKGRVYVGTRDEHVLGFGSPVSPPLTSSPVDFGAITVLASAARTVQLTAAHTVSVTSVATSQSDFVVDSVEPALPVTLQAGDVLGVHVTFTPHTSGLKGATLQVVTNETTASVALSGRGQSVEAELSATPPLVSFGGVGLGHSLIGSVTFSNTGGAPLTILGAQLPQAPFEASGVPDAGAVLGSGQAVTLQVMFSPTALGSFQGALTLRTSAGDEDVGLSGSATPPAHLSLSAISKDYGKVAVGGSRVLRFALTNDGGSTLTITKSKPPVLGPFAATTLLPEGTTLAAGASLVEEVTFAPQMLGAFADGWDLNADDGTGPRRVEFAGEGAPGISTFTGSGWALNGTAKLSGETLELTDASTSDAAGSAFWTTALDTASLAVSFDLDMGGGSGADGATLTLADPSTPPTALGAKGGGLGTSGIAGSAIAFDTYANGTDRSNNFVGVTQRTLGGPDQLDWLATSTAIPPLRGQTRHVTVLWSNGTLTVYLDGDLALTATVALPPTALVGFTAGSGGLTDRHAISHVSIVSSILAAEPPPPFSTKINFQPTGDSLVAGYLVDDGSPYAPHGELIYGWSGDNRANTRNRNAVTDKRLDTLIHLQKPSLPNASWEIAVPNGTYSVHITSGDPQHIDSHYLLAVEGVVALDGVPDANTLWFEATTTTVVADGRLTVTNAPGSSNNKLNSIEIVQQ